MKESCILIFNLKFPTLCASWYIFAAKPRPSWFLSSTILIRHVGTSATSHQWQQSSSKRPTGATKWSLCSGMLRDAPPPPCTHLPPHSLAVNLVRVVFCQYDCKEFLRKFCVLAREFHVTKKLTWRNLFGGCEFSREVNLQVCNAGFFFCTSDTVFSACGCKGVISKSIRKTFIPKSIHSLGTSTLQK